MKRRLRRIVSWLCVLTLCLGLLPSTALAAVNETIYNNPQSGISITVHNSKDAIVEKTINFKVVVDGTTTVGNHPVEVPLTGTEITVNAEGYDVEFETETSVSVSSYGSNNYLVAFTNALLDTYGCTINLASSKKSDNIEIKDDAMTYGTFHWAKGAATTSAFSRELTVYVNGEEVHTQKINTPQVLENTATNKQYWFTPNSDEYVMDYEFSPQYSVDTVRRNISVYLTTKCKCGQELCQCEGGCSCESGCPCDDCVGTTEPGEIITPYGTITYKPDEDGYNLTVDIYVNGEIAYEGKQIKVQNDRAGNLNFDVAESKGYYFYTDNGYDLDAHYGQASWGPILGNLYLGATEECKDYDNTLSIYLWTFENPIEVDVERVFPVSDKDVTGYILSYEAFDPEQNANRTYTYTVTNFLAAQTPYIPMNTDVTITAICKDGYEVTDWWTSETRADLSGEDHNTLTLKLNEATVPRILVSIRETAPVTPPTDDQLKDLLNQKIQVSCTANVAEHTGQTYNLKLDSVTTRPASVTGNALNNYAYTIAIKSDAYVDDYNVTTQKEHTPGSDTEEIVLEYVNNAWTVKSGETPVVFEVTCDDGGEEPDPEPGGDKITEFSKTVMTGPVTGIEGTYDYPVAEDDQNVVTVAEGDTEVTLLYAITVEGTAGTEFTVTDTGADLVSGAGDTGITEGQNGTFTGTIPDNGTITFYVSKTFTSVNEGDTLTNRATVTSGDETETDTEEVTVEVDDGEEPNPETASYTVEYIFLDEKGVKVDDTESWTSDDIFPKGDSDVKVGMEVYIVPPESVTVDNTDHYILVEGNYSCTISKDGPNTITVTYALDNWKDDDDTDSETGGDEIPDYQQALVKFVSANASQGTVTGDGATQVFTLKDSTGAYTESGTITPVNDDIDVKPSDGYAFDIWTEGTAGTTAVNPFTSRTVNGGDEITFYANFDKDEIGEENPDEGDGIPDKYQATVTYKIVGGMWSDGSSADIKEVFTLKEKDEDGQWEDKNPTLGDTIPTGMTPDATHVIPGNWNTAINENTPVTENVTYTYIFTTAEPSLIVLKSVSPTSDVGLGDELTYTIKVTNNGNQALTDVTVTDTMWGDEVTSISVDDSTVSVGAAGYTIQNLPVGETVTITYTYTVTADDLGQTISNHVTAKAEGEDGPEGDDSTTTEVDEGELTVTIQPADITIYTGGQGYTGIIGDEDGEDFVGTGSGLPEPGYYIELPKEVNDALLTALDMSEGTVLDLSEYVEFTYDDGEETRTWELERYDRDGESQAYSRYVYRLLPALVDGEEIPVRLAITGETVEDTVLSDVFDVNLNQALYRVYNMDIYPGDLDQGLIQLTIKDEVGGNLAGTSYDMEPESGTLTIRGVTGGEETAVIGEHTDSGFRADVPNGTTYTINESDIGVNDHSNVQLLVDEIVTEGSVSDANAVVDALVENSLDALDGEDIYLGEDDVSFDMRYMDLVDGNNGNVYVTASEDVTILWPMPNDADRRGDFHVVHFDGLDREFHGEDAVDEINGCAPEVIDAETVRIDGQWYVAFDTDSFSPFVLVYEAEDDDDDRPRPPRPDDDDDDEDEDDVEEPDEAPVDDGLNREDHYAYIIGYEDGTVRPDGNITRAEVATIFFRLMTDEYREDCWSTSSGFTDVTAANWYNNAISTTAQAGWIAGYEDGSFRPDAYITRAEFATIAARFLSEGYAGGHRFNDIQGHWAAEYIDRAAAAGWIGGYEDGTFRPNAYITRAEVATLVNRMLDRAPDVGHLLPDMVRWPDNPETAWYYADIQEATNSHDYTWAGTGHFEVWTELLPNRDWAALEEIWSQANDAPGGEVMD